MKAYLILLILLLSISIQSRAQNIDRYSISVLPSLNKNYGFGKNMFDTEIGTKVVSGFELGYDRIFKTKLILHTGLGYTNSGSKIYSQTIDNDQRKQVFFSEYSTPTLYIPIRLGYQHRLIEASLGVNLRYDFKTSIYKSRLGAYYTEDEGGIFEERGAIGFDFSSYYSIIENQNEQVQFGVFLNTIPFTSNSRVVTYGLALKWSRLKL